MEVFCVFQSILDCSNNDELVDALLTLARQDKVKQCSGKRGDNFYETLNPNCENYYHQNCYLKYTSNSHIDRYLKRQKQNEESTSTSSAAKRQKRSSTPLFDFKKNCLICGEACNPEKDKKHPDRWNKNKNFLCRTADRGAGKLSFKEVLLKVCTIFSLVTYKNV